MPRKKKDPRVGTGKKPKGSGRRLYTDENPKDTVRIKFATPADARATVAKVKKIKNSLRSIHIGWNHVQLSGKSTTLSHSGFAYFVHAFACHPRDNNVVIGTTEYGEQFPSVIQMEKVFGVQFHPEKSQDFGLDILKRFSHV